MLYSRKAVLNCSCAGESCQVPEIFHNQDGQNIPWIPTNKKAAPNFCPSHVDGYSVSGTKPQVLSWETPQVCSHHWNSNIYIYTQIYSNSTKTWPLVTRSLTFPSPFFSIESDVCSFQCSTAIPFPEIIPGWFTSLSWQLIALPSISNLSTMSLWITRDEQSVDSNDWFDEIWPKSPVTFQCPQWNPWIYMSWLG